MNLHRKQFGSIKNVILENNVKKVFLLQGLSLRFEHPKKVEEAYKKGVLSEKGWQGFLLGRKSYLTKQLTICKKNKMNICSKCGVKFFVTANKAGACKVTK